jgi:hypothetical protein
MSKQQSYFVVLVLVFLTSACSSFFRNAGANLADGVDAKALTASVIATLNEEATKDQLAAVLDRLIVSSDTSINELLSRVAFDTLTQQLLSTVSTQLAESPLPDTLQRMANALTQRLTKDLMDTVLTQLNSEHTTQQLQQFKAGLLDEQTTALISRRLQQIIAELPLREITTQLRDDLLGEATKASLASIVDTSMSIVVARMNKDISPVIDDKMSFLQRYAKQLLAVMALLALGIIAFVWWQRRKYYKLIGIVASKIDELPDQQAYDHLTAGIRSKAVEEGLETTLQSIMASYGIKASESWKKHKKTSTDA